MTEAEPVETRDQKYVRQTKESFEYLGRFVQAFEYMVSVTRMHCVMITTRGVKHQLLVNTILYHSSLTAMPLFEIMRGLIGQIIKDPDNKMTSREIGIANQILKQSELEFRSLITQRNDLLHGHWSIGWSNPADTDFSGLNVSKFKTTKTGYEAAPTPKTIAEMKVLIERCENLGNLLGRFGVCINPEIRSLERNFSKVGKIWMTPDQKKKLDS